MYNGINDILELLKHFRIKEALTQLQGLCSQTKDWQLRNKIEEIQTAYGYMLQYAAQGMKDPNRESFYQQTIRSVYELTEWANIILETEKNMGAYYDILRTFSIRPPHTYSELQLQLEAYTEDFNTAPLLYPETKRRETEIAIISQRHETAVNELFEKTWASLFWTEVEYHEALTLLNSVLISPNDLAVMVSALTLSLLQLFDVRKLIFLFEAYKHESLIVNQRALVGILLTIYHRQYRLEYYPEITARLSLLWEKESFCQNVYTIMMQLLQTRETHKIDKKMREEIIPEMIKQTRRINPKFRFEENEDPEEQNPEWEKWVDQSGFSDKIREMGEWQMAGADVYMGSFAQLKHFPFFQQISHWFYQFDVDQPAISFMKKELSQENFSPLKLIFYSDFFCNSDKYSFCFAIQHMPKGMKDATIAQMNEQATIAEEQRHLLEAKMNKPKEAKDISRQYIQDLYRFFKLNRKHNKAEDIFTWSFDFWNEMTWSPLFYQSTYTKQLADYLFQKEYYEDAYELYKLVKSQSNSAEIWQKLGFICQQKKNYGEAIRNYNQADLIVPDNLWTLKHLAQCYRKQENFKEALIYYKKIECIEPENLNIALQIGQCLSKQEKYSEALAYFYKVEYLEKKPDNARRAIAWCSFLIKKYTEALKYYNLILEQSSPKAEDWLNTGHAYLSIGKIEAALKHYQKAHEYASSHSEFISSFNEDKEILLAQGISSEDIQITLDLLA